MKKQFEQDGIEFTIEVDFTKSTREEGPNGALTHFIDVKSKNGRYEMNHEVSLWDRLSPNLKLFEESVSSAELMARDWVKSHQPGWEQKTLLSLGFDKDCVDERILPEIKSIIADFGGKFYQKDNGKISFSTHDLDEAARKCYDVMNNPLYNSDLTFVGHD